MTAALGAGGLLRRYDADDEVEGEESGPGSAAALGNVPQALTHLSHVEAALALANRVPPPG